MNIKNLIITILISAAILSFYNVNNIFNERTRTIEKSFNLQDDKVLNISNKYGSVIINTWDKNEVQFIIHIIVKASSDRKVDEMHDMINVKFNESQRGVSAETIIETNSFWSWGNSSKYEINYEVLMPENAYLELRNKYGKSHIASLKRNIEAKIKYGTIYMDSQTERVDLDLKYSTGKLDYVNEFVGEVKYSDLRCGKMNRATIHTGYSDVNIEEVLTLELDSGYDDIKINKVTNLECDARYGEIEINSLGKGDLDCTYTEVDIKNIYQDLKVDMRYGELNIDRVHAAVNRIDIEASYVDIEIDCGVAECEVRMEGQYTDYDLSERFDVISKEKVDKILNLNARHGNGATLLNIDMDFGDLQVD